MQDNGLSPDRYALVGHPVGHSRSPLIHTLFARQTEQNLSYELIEAEPAQLETAVRGFQSAGGRGMNVTVPHKEAAFALSDVFGAEAAAARAVNTLSFADGQIRGDNTDGIGLVRDIVANRGWRLAGRRLVILGAGGAARGIVGPLLDQQPAGIVVANRTVARAEALVEMFADQSGALSVTAFDALEPLGAFDLVINATSAGLKGEQPPFPGSLIESTTCCYDLAYSLGQTPFVAWAEQHGAAQAIQGWGMLVEQAAESFRIWRGIMPDTASILERLADPVSR